MKLTPQNLETVLLIGFALLCVAAFVWIAWMTYKTHRRLDESTKQLLDANERAKEALRKYDKSAQAVRESMQQLDSQIRINGKSK